MKIRKAVITAAAPGQRDLPLQSLVDRDGARRSVLSIQVAEMARAGTEEVCIVCRPGDEEAYHAAVAPELAERVRFAPQPEPRGYGHAVWCARAFTAGEPFLHQVGDHLYLPAGGDHAAERVCSVAAENSCAVSGVQPTRENLLPYFGTVGGQRIKNTSDLYAVESVAEKPTPTEAEQTLLVPGLRAGHYLCFMGTHVLTPAAMDLLDRHVAAAGQEGRGIQLSPVLDELAGREKYLAVETPGRRYPLDTRYGLLHAQLALALSGVDRDEVLTGLVDLLAAGKMGR